MNKRIAEALVECGYAVSVKYKDGRGNFDNPVIYTPDDNRYPIGKICDPLADTLEGRRQLEALFDYFAKGMSPICHFDYQCLIPIGLQMRTFVTKCIEDAEKDNEHT